MADKLRVELNREGVRELLNSPEMESILEELASGIAGRAGEGYEHDTKKLSTRVVASAYTATPKAMKDSMKNNTLLKAMHG